MGAVWLLVLLWLLMLLLPFCWVLALRRVCRCFCCRAQIVRLRVRRLAALERQKEFTDRGGTAPPAGAAKTTTVRSHCPAASCQVLKERKKNGHSSRQLNARPPIDAACCWPGSQNGVWLWQASSGGAAAKAAPPKTAPATGAGGRPGA